MTLSPNINNLEKDKFEETSDGKTAVKVINIGGFVDSSVSNEVSVAYPDSITEDYTFKNDTTIYKVLRVVYTDSTKQNLLSVKRTS